MNDDIKHSESCELAAKSDISDAPKKTKSTAQKGCFGCLKFVIGVVVLFNLTFYSSCMRGTQNGWAYNASKKALSSRYLDNNVYTQDSWDAYEASLKNLDNTVDKGSFTSDLRSATDEFNKSYRNLVVDRDICMPLDYEKISKFPEQYKGTPVVLTARVIKSSAKFSGDYKLDVIIDDDPKKVAIVKNCQQGYGTRYMDGDMIRVYGVADFEKSYRDSGYVYIPLFTQTSIDLLNE